jgi:hypothetical protein
VDPASDEVVSAGDVVAGVERRIPADEPVVAAAAPGGLFLNQGTLAAERVSDDDVIGALERLRSTSGVRLMDQVFPGLAVSFARYC